MLIIQIVAPVLFKPADELGALFMLILIGLDMAINHRLVRYKGMFIVAGIMGLYALYSLCFLNFNTPTAIIIDFVIEQKPFVPFFISFALAPRYTHKECQILKATSLLIAAIVLMFFLQAPFSGYLPFHVATFGSIAFMCFLTYIFCSIGNDGTISKRDLSLGLCVLAVGLCCTRAKYFGEAVMAVFLLCFYRPGMFKRIKMKQMAIIVLVLTAVLIVSWEKINFYFIVGNSDTFDPEVIESFARPALIGGAFLILCDFPLLGTGLASYATHASTPFVHYSAVYGIYDLDKVYGLSEQYPNFICDMFYASFAQFGIMGIILFIAFFVWIYQRLRLVLHNESHMMFVVGVLVIAYVMIENIGNTHFSQAGGLYAMMMLGAIIGKYRNCTKEQRALILQQEYK
ncbi:MAG: hypothetical protein ACI308_10920 [Muribaculaceae bacterium]